MSKYKLWVNMNYGWRDRQTNTQTHTHTETPTDIHINTMTQPGLGGGPSENIRTRGLGNDFAVSSNSVSIINYHKYCICKTRYTATR